jgi:hypothetical protein
LNDRSDQASSSATGDTGTWGYKQGQGSATAARNLLPELSSHADANTAYTTAKNNTGFMTSNNTAGNNYEYRLPLLPAGNYTYVGYSRDWWNSGRNLRHEVLRNTGTGATVAAAFPSATTWTNVTSAGQTFTGNFTISEAQASQQHIIRVTTNSAQGPVLGWIQIIDRDKVRPDILDTVVTPLADRAMFADQLTPEGIRTSLPQTLEARNMAGNIVTCDVSWRVPLSFRTFQTVTITGLLTSRENPNRTLTTSFKAEVVPRNLLYFIDANAMVQSSAGSGGTSFPSKAPGSWAYNLVKALVPDLLNEVPDKARGQSDKWGYTMTGMGSVVNDGWLRALSATDKFDYGWFSYSANEGTPTELTYDLDLQPGVYKVSMGAAEYWTGTKNRPYVFSVKNGGTVLARTLGLLESTASVQGRNIDELTIMLIEAATVTVSVKFDSENELNLSGVTLEEPHVSWLAVEKVEVDNKLYLDVSTTGIVTASADYFPTDGGPTDVTIILALYDDNDRLIAINHTAATAPPYDLSASLEKGAAAYAKAFLWDSAAFAPVVAAEEIVLQ